MSVEISVNCSSNILMRKIDEQQNEDESNISYEQLLNMFCNKVNEKVCGQSKAIGNSIKEEKVLTTSIGPNIVCEKQGECQTDERTTRQNPEIDCESKEMEEEVPLMVYATNDLEYMYMSKKKKKRKRKPAQSKESYKKWTKVDISVLSFDYSLLPRHQSHCDYNEDEVQLELSKFEQKIEDETEEEERMNKEKQSEAANTAVLETEKINYRYIINYSPDDKDYLEYQWDDHPGLFLFEDMLNLNQSNFLCNLERKHMILRDKTKFHTQKARNQVKTHHCLSIKNKPHGHKLFVHHRVYKRMKMSICVTGTKWIVSMKNIDKQREKCMQSSTCNINATQSNSNKHYPVAQPMPTAAITAYNFDADLPANVVNILMNLQHRDLTPEDYDILLQLDERVAPKTLDSSKLSSMKTDIVTEQSAGDMCSVCMEMYELGQKRKFLPCGHIFHQECIDMWLSNSSPSCPLDGIDLEGSI